MDEETRRAIARAVRRCEARIKRIGADASMRQTSRGPTSPPAPPPTRVVEYLAAIRAGKD